MIRRGPKPAHLPGHDRLSGLVVMSLMAVTLMAVTLCGWPRLLTGQEPPSTPASVPGGATFPDSDPSPAPAVPNLPTVPNSPALPMKRVPVGASTGAAVEPVNDDFLRKQIQNLNNPSYRSRQQAVWYLEQYAQQALPLLKEAGNTTDLNIGAEIIALLSSQAMSPDTRISVAAHEALQKIAGGSHSVTAVSQLALNSLAGIADRQEVLAKQALEDLNVYLGDLHLTINGAMQNEGFGREPSLILYVNDDFRGRPEHFRLFRFLRSYDTVYLEGKSITEEMVREVVAMPELKRLVLRGPNISNATLQVLFEARELVHLELVYASGVDDNAISTLVDLPLVGSLRLFGTKLSADGTARIKRDLDGLDIYIGKGGFLGVKTNVTDLRISQITKGSAADLGGMMPQDTITHINGKPIKLFEELRTELAHFMAGEHVSVQVERPVYESSRRGTQTVKLDIVLGEQPAQSN